MVASVSTPTDLVNLSLVRVGYKKSIGSLYDGSEAAKIALRVYSQTRDELLRQNDFDFAERTATMTLLKQAPAGGYVPPMVWSNIYPPQGYLFEYAYPDDCLKVRAIKPQPIFLLEFDPQPVVYTTANDATFTPPQMVILCNVQNAIMTYTAQITDLTAWDTDTIEAFAGALGRRLAPALVGLNAAKLAVEDEQASFAVAEKEQG